jgi:hypothetical protein
MPFELKLNFYLKKGSIIINDFTELTTDGRKILEMIKSEKDETFQECCKLLKENLSVLYITSNANELEEIFESDDDEITVNEFDVVKIFKVNHDEICFSVEGNFTLQVKRKIENEDQLRAIEDELGGSFDNGVTIQVPVFVENEDDPFAEPNGGDGDTISSWAGLGVSFKN